VKCGPGDSEGGVGQSPLVEGGLRHERVLGWDGSTQGPKDGNECEKVGLAPN